ncbi:MAG: hypothetical protein HOH74_00160, partial [Gemmatimonadetes bacterium]|nr:hypothetical protein [Gemmatimonadota bacterium]
MQDTLLVEEAEKKNQQKVVLRRTSVVGVDIGLRLAIATYMYICVRLTRHGAYHCTEA